MLHTLLPVYAFLSWKYVLLDICSNFSLSLNIYIHICVVLNSLGVTPLFTRASTPHAGGLPIRAYERILLEVCCERTLRSPQPFLFRSRDRGQQGGEHAPAASGGRTFWNIPYLKYMHLLYLCKYLEHWTFL